MKLYLIKQNVNDDYDTYDSAVVAAESKRAARFIHPCGNDSWDGKNGAHGTWANANNVEVQYLGEASIEINRGVICASFNAG